MINFDEIEEIELKNFLGGDNALFMRTYCDELNRIMKITLPPKSSIGMHTHETSSEILYVLTGKGKTILDGKEESLKQGDCSYCKKGSAHTLINDSDDNLVVLAIVPQQ